MEPSDHELIDRFVNGDNKAFEDLVYRYDRQVLSIASRYTQDSDAAKDIYQEVFMRVFRGLRNFEKRSQFSTWLHRIVVNVCLSYVAKRKKQVSGRTIVYYSDDSKEELISEERSEKLSEATELREKIQIALTALSPRQRMAFILKNMEQLKISEIAERMHCAEGTIKKYLFEAVQKLRTHLYDVYEEYHETI